MAKKTLKNKKTGTKTAGISDDAVKKATGKSWSQWNRILDKAGAATLPHKDIASFVDKKYPSIGSWWAQMVTVGYEQARGLRTKHQKPGGFEVGASKTISASVNTVFKAWKDAKTRKRWLQAYGLLIHKSTPNKSMRITWTDGQKSVSVNFYPKGAGKCQVAVQHGKLPNAKDAAAKKKYWGQQLNKLKTLVEA